MSRESLTWRDDLGDEIAQHVLVGQGHQRHLARFEAVPGAPATRVAIVPITGKADFMVENRVMLIAASWRRKLKSWRSSGGNCISLPRRAFAIGSSRWTRRHGNTTLPSICGPGALFEYSRSGRGPDMEYRQFFVCAFERAPGKWRAKIGRTDGKRFKAKGQ